MKNRLVAFVFTAIVLALSCTQVYAKGNNNNYGGGNYSHDNSSHHHHGYNNNNNGYGDGNCNTKPGCGHETVSVPEPSTLALLGIGLIGVAFAGRKKR